MALPPDLDRLLERAHFPGTTAAETRLLRQFLARHGAEWDTVDVEAKIGRGTILPPTTDEKARADWERRTRARPDLVLQRAPDYVAIVEAKEQLTNEGIWQVLTYRDLWTADRPRDKVECIAIAEGATPNAVQLAKDRGVRVFLYTFTDRALPADPAAEATP